MRIVKKGFVLVVSAIVLVTIGLYFMQEKLIFLPTKLSQDYKYQFSEPFEELFLETEDGARLNALHFKIDSPKGVILYFHGNAGDLSRWGEITSGFTKYGYDVVVMDYRTYGKSTGGLSEENLYNDAQLFYDYTSGLYPENKIVIYGRSIGTGLATFIAANNKPSKLILETPFFNFSEAVKNRVPILPVKYLLKYKFPSNTFIVNTNCPTLMFHGTKDKIVPYKSGERLSKLVSSTRLTFITIPEGEHNNLMSFEDYRKELESFLK